MEKRECPVICFDGISGAWKSWASAMLSEILTVDWLIFSENKYDPLREVTSQVNKQLKTQRASEVVDNLPSLQSLAKDINLAWIRAKLKNIWNEKPLDKIQWLDDLQTITRLHKLNLDELEADDAKQVILAYLFSMWRWYSQLKLEELKKQYGLIILDRRLWSTMSYQATKTYTRRDIENLNFLNWVKFPTISIILHCPADQIHPRRALRDKKVVWTSGQMSNGRELTIMETQRKIVEDFSSFSYPISLLVNKWTPTQDIKEQIKQACNIFWEIYNKINPMLDPWTIMQFWSKEDLVEYMLEDERVERIVAIQCNK